ncbi:MAG: DUF1330 domain-containing protein [Rhodospirillaceae bacterium]|nr:DUF1330 domain-containing protein [Rhodospirillaceae bacterium]
MPAYLIVYMTVSDPEQLKKYQALTPAAIAKYDGRFVVRGGRKETVEGPEEPRRVVVVEFPSYARAQEFWASPDYRAAAKLREGAAVFNAVIVEGV